MVLKLRAQATLATRPEKQIKSLAGLTRDWRERATRLLGTDATGWARALLRGEAPRRLLRAGRDGAGCGAPPDLDSLDSAHPSQQAVDGLAVRQPPRS